VMRYWDALPARADVPRVQFSSILGRRWTADQDGSNMIGPVWPGSA